MKKEKLVLAYSGGLDTSVIVHWLDKQGYEVIALCLNLGQKVEDIESILEKGKQSGATKVLVENVEEEFVKEYVMPSIHWNALYEGTYLLGTSLARPLISKKQIEVASREGAVAVAHGATGKGKDQVRFELSYYALNPNIKVVAPWKIPDFYKKYPGRSELLAYAKKYKIPVKASKNEPWSSDENLMHISFESGMLEDPWQAPSQDMFELSKSPKDAVDEKEEIFIEFKNGTPIEVNGKEYKSAKLLGILNDFGGKHGIGRVDMVESRFVGMKNRGVYETPGGTILHVAHRAIESITLNRGVINLKDSLMPRFAQLTYDGFWFSPEMEVLLSMVKKTQESVNGTVRLELYKGNCTVTGRKSPNSLYDRDMATMEADQGAYDPKDAIGFIKLHALPLKIQAGLKIKSK